MKPRFRAEWVVVREELMILASCLLRPMSRNSMFAERFERTLRERFQNVIVTNKNNVLLERSRNVLSERFKRTLVERI